MRAIEEIMRTNEPYVASFRDVPTHLQGRAKHLCWRLNQTDPTDEATRNAIVRELFGTAGETTLVSAGFRCDYGFNIHALGMALINYNCSFLDTSPITLGAGCFIAPGCVLTCAGHSIDAEQRTAGLLTSAPITLGENVWLGANVTVCPGVTIGAGSVIGAGSTVVRDIPAGVVAVGSPAHVLRPVTEADRLGPTSLA